MAWLDWSGEARLGKARIGKAGLDRTGVDRLGLEWRGRIGKHMAVDWLAIEGEYRAGQKTPRAIGAEYGVPESTIRFRAKKNGWMRDPAATKRERVKAHFSGVAQDATQATMRNIEQATGQAVYLENLALENAEKALLRIRDAFDNKENMDSGDIKRLSEANRINLDTVRQILNLNDPVDRPAVEYANEAPFPDPLT